jgi:hypothetical protein
MLLLSKKDLETNFMNFNSRYRWNAIENIGDN